MSKWTVVLTGGIGSGKSLVANIFAAKDVTIVEQDDLAREIVEPGTPALKKITERFGKDILLEDGWLDRAALRKQIFQDPAERLWLNRLTHPLINKLTRERVNTSTSPYALVVNPLLAGRSGVYDRFLVVDVPLKLQLKRTMERDSISRTLAQKMISSQTVRSERLKFADDVILNDGSVERVAKQVDSLHKRYLFMAS